MKGIVHVARGCAVDADAGQIANFKAAFLPILGKGSQGRAPGGGKGFNFIGAGLPPCLRAA